MLLMPPRPPARQVMTGMVPSLGTCRGWRFSADPKDFKPRYSPVWTGPLSELQAGTTFGPYQQVRGTAGGGRATVPTARQDGLLRRGGREPYVGLCAFPTPQPKASLPWCLLLPQRAFLQAPSHLPSRDSPSLARPLPSVLIHPPFHRCRSLLSGQ